MKFQNSSIQGFKVMLCIKKREERTEGRTDGRTEGRTDGRKDGRTNNPEAICPSNFFEVGGIIRPLAKEEMFKGFLGFFYFEIRTLAKDEMSFEDFLFFSSPEQKLRVSYCHHPMSVVCRSSSTISLLTL